MQGRGRPPQVIRTYRGGNLDGQFRRDAAKLAADGYIVQSQSYGGYRRAGLGSALTLGLLGGRKPREMTVVYVLAS